MFNAYIAEQRLQSITEHDYQELNEKYQTAKHQTHRDKLSEQYRKRIANFIKEMVSEPIVTHDEYMDEQSNKLMLSKRLIGQSHLHKKVLQKQKKNASRSIPLIKNRINESSCKAIDQEDNEGEMSETMIFPPRFRFTDTKEEKLERNKIWNSYFDVKPNVNPLKAVFSRHYKNQTQLGPIKIVKTSRNQSQHTFIPAADSTQFTSLEITARTLGKSDIIDTKNSLPSTQRLQSKLSKYNTSRILDPSSKSLINVQNQQSMLNTSLQQTMSRNIPIIDRQNFRKSYFKAVTTVGMRQGGVLNFDKEDPELNLKLQKMLQLQQIAREKKYGSNEIVKVLQEKAKMEGIQFIKKKQEESPYDYSSLSKEMLSKCNVVRRKNINIFKTREQLAKEYNLSML